MYLHFQFLQKRQWVLPKHDQMRLKLFLPPFLFQCLERALFYESCFYQGLVIQGRIRCLLEIAYGCYLGQGLQ